MEWYYWVLIILFILSVIIRFRIKVKNHGGKDNDE